VVFLDVNDWAVNLTDEESFDVAWKVANSDNDLGEMTKGLNLRPRGKQFLLPPRPLRATDPAGSVAGADQ